VGANRSLSATLIIAVLVPHPAPTAREASPFSSEWCERAFGWLCIPLSALVILIFMMMRFSTRAPIIARSMMRFSTRAPIIARSGPLVRTSVRSLATVNPVVPDHEPWAPPVLDAKPNTTDFDSVSERHWAPMHGSDAWSLDEVEAARDTNTMMHWGATNAIAGLPFITKAEGVYLYGRDGKRYIDWTSQAVCNNLGSSVPPAVMSAIVEQLETVPFVYGGLALTDVRVRLSALLSEVLPGDLTGLLFPSGGSEANEAAVRMARRFTGRRKILSQYRSYHGGTSSALGATGDFRRGFDESNTGGFVKMINPAPHCFAWGDTPEQGTNRALAALEEQILGEGPESIAAVMMESIIGSGGVFKHPVEYVRGVRALCDKYGILYIADEVMVGFGRTGTLFGFQHYEGVVPDIVTSAKGLSASYLPLSMVATRTHIQEHFRSSPLGWGATFQAHPVSLACAYECLKHMIRHDVVGNARALEPAMQEWTQKLIDNHPSVRGGRAYGLFGCLDLQGPDGARFQTFAGPPHPAQAEFKKALLANGIYGLTRPPIFHTAPPLIVNEAELNEGFEGVDDALYALDKALFA
jgi:taurine--2-oxoglutarate transaminase